VAEKCRERPIFIAGWTPGRIGNYKKKAFLPAFASFYIFPSLGGEGIEGRVTKAFFLLLIPSFRIPNQVEDRLDAACPGLDRGK